MLYNAYLNIIIYKKVNYITYSALYGTNLNQNKMTAVEWLYIELWKQNDYSLPSNLLDQAKEMEKQEKLKIQIAENESVLEMLRLHGSDASIMRVFSRLESLKEQLKELTFKSE